MQTLTSFAVVELADLARVQGGAGTRADPAPNKTSFEIPGVGSGSTARTDRAQCVADTQKFCSDANQSWFQRNVWGGTNAGGAQACSKDLVPLCNQ